MSSSRDNSTLRSLHRLVEHYTPSGGLGRALLGGPALLIGPILFLGGLTAFLSGAELPMMVVSLFMFVFGIPTTLLGVFTLWPVYLSVIGNVESSSAYPENATKPSEAAESPAAVLKRRYANGEITREEFERRLSDVLNPVGGGDWERETERGRTDSTADRDERAELEMSRNK